MATTSILPFAPTDIGTNLLSDADYLAATNRTNGNQPGIASSKLKNKALRQASAIAAGVAQFMADQQATNVTDALTPAQISTMLGNAAKGRLIARRVFTTTQLYTQTPGTNSVDVTVVAGGGGGGGAAVNPAGQFSAGAGGGGGGWSKKRITAGFSGVTITVGAGGTGAPPATTAGAGGTSSFGSLLSATGGTGGSTGGSSTVPGPFGAGTPGIGSLGDVNFAGGVGHYAYFGTAPTSGDGGSSYGGGGAAWVTASGVATPGNAAVGYGCGGGGAASAPSTAGATGGNGAAGVVIVEEYS